METDSIKEEILLVNNTAFIQKYLSEKESLVGVKLLSQREQLVQAYWNGVLDELLQKSIQQTKCRQKLFIKHLHQEDCSLQIILSDFNSILNKQSVEMQTSINPSLFLPELIKN
jgi:hypothetical protein